jgi:predicted nucleic-acid-binding protein
MIGLDTNVIVRYIVQDDPAQSSAAAKLMDSLSPDAPGFVAMVVAVELVWVLQSCYRSKRDEIVHVLETLLRSKELMLTLPIALLSAAATWRNVNTPSPLIKMPLALRG